MTLKNSLKLLSAGALGLAVVMPSQTMAQAAPVVVAADQQVFLGSSDPKLAANKKLVYNMWRTLLEAGQVDQAPKFLAEDYIQHNPNVASGRAPVVEFLSNFVKPKPLEDTIPGMISMIAEGDLVVINFVREYQDPRDATKTYTTTWSDMFRVVDGVIVEHWDSSLKF